MGGREGEKWLANTIHMHYLQKQLQVELRVTSIGGDDISAHAQTKSFMPIYIYDRISHPSSDQDVRGEGKGGSRSKGRQKMERVRGRE